VLEPNPGLDDFYDQIVPLGLAWSGRIGQGFDEGVCEVQRVAKRDHARRIRERLAGDSVPNRILQRLEGPVAQTQHLHSGVRGIIRDLGADARGKASEE
jgi:hypothetical protein